jgi:prevent-host-death family protein
MGPAETTEPITELKTKTARLIRRARETGRPIVITQNGRATAILQDVGSFERQRRALHLLRLMADGDQELRAGEGVEHEVAMGTIRRRIRDPGDE